MSGILEGDFINSILDLLPDDEVLALFSNRGLFSSSHVQPNEVFQLPNGLRIRLTQHQYNRMRDRVNSINAQRSQLTKAPKQTLRKRLF